MKAKDNFYPQVFSPIATLPRYNNDEGCEVAEIPDHPIYFKGLSIFAAFFGKVW